MKKKRMLGSFFVYSAVLFLFTSAYAALTDNLDGTVTEIRNDGSVLMWLKDANYARTSGYCSISGNCYNSAGQLTWSQAHNWIAYLNDTNYAGYSDWRLPATLPVNGTSYNWNWSYNGSTDRG